MIFIYYFLYHATIIDYGNFSKATSVVWPMASAEALATINTCLVQVSSNFPHSKFSSSSPPLSLSSLETRIVVVIAKRLGLL